MKGKRGTAKAEILHHSMRRLLWNTAACFTKEKLALGVPTCCLLVTSDFTQGLFSPCSMAGLLALEVNPFTDFPWSLKCAYLVWNGTKKWDLIPISTVFIPLPERARVSLEILQIQKMLKKPLDKPKQTGKLTHFSFLGLLGLTFLCLRLCFSTDWLLFALSVLFHPSLFSHLRGTCSMHFPLLRMRDWWGPIARCQLTKAAVLSSSLWRLKVMDNCISLYQCWYATYVLCSVL